MVRVTTLEDIKRRQAAKPAGSALAGEVSCERRVVEKGRSPQPAVVAMYTSMFNSLRDLRLCNNFGAVVV